MKRLNYFAFCFAVALYGCGRTDNITDPPKPKPPRLSIDWVGSVEIGLHVSASEAGLYAIARDSTRLFFGFLAKTDTTFIDTGLLPAAGYQYRGVRLDETDSSEVASGEMLRITTQDTTSHDYNWQIHEIGNLGGLLKDVAVISENDVWAVGFVPVEPYSSADFNNAAHWDGNRWEMLQVPVRIFNGDFARVRIATAYAFSPDNVWMFSEAGSYSHWNGQDWESKWVPDRGGGDTDVGNFKLRSLFSRR